jgi:hypothetical protein
MIASRAVALLAYVLLVVACGSRTGLDASPLGPIGAPVGLRLVAPLSTSTVTSQQPTLRWILGADKDGAQIDLCADRACTSGVVTFTATGTHASPPAALAPGVHFWRARSTSNGKLGDTWSPVWEFWVGARSTPVDTSWGTTLDLNGDGLPDLAVGAPNANSMLGKAYVYLGSHAGFSTTPSTTLAGVAIPAAPDQGFFGTSVASAGDLNGDGYGDFVVGSISDGDGEPLAYVYYGGPSGIASTATILTDHKRGGFTSSVAAAGDVNGDGYGDLIVGEMDIYTDSTTAWIYFGGAFGVSAASATMLVGPKVPGSIAGPIVASAGDLDGDGFADVFVGADYFLNTGGGTSMVYLGGPHGPSATPLATLTAPGGADLSYGDTPPCAVDLDGDGYADLVLRGSGDGEAYVYPGGKSAFSSTPALVITASTPDTFGWAVSLATGDVDGDGYQDLLVGSNGEQSDTGAVFVYRGGPQGLASSPAFTLVGPDGPEALFGSAVAASDVDGDGFADVVVGAFRFNGDDGRAYVYKASASGLASPAATILDALEAGEWFGASVI